MSYLNPRNPCHYGINIDLLPKDQMRIRIKHLPDWELNRPLSEESIKTLTYHEARKDITPKARKEIRHAVGLVELQLAIIQHLSNGEPTKDPVMCELGAIFIEVTSRHARIEVLKVTGRGGE